MTKVSNDIINCEIEEPDDTEKIEKLKEEKERITSEIEEFEPEVQNEIEKIEKDVSITIPLIIDANYAATQLDRNIEFDYQLKK